MSSVEAEPVSVGDATNPTKEDAEVSKINNQSEGPDKSQASNDGASSKAQERLERFKALKARAVSQPKLS